MKTLGLFLLLAGVLTAGAKTLVDDNLPGEIEDEELTDEAFDSLKSEIHERALTGDLELAGQLDDDAVDLDSLKSAMEERALAEDLDDDDADLEKSAMEERGLTGEPDGHPVDVARRRLKCGGGKCEACKRILLFLKVCIGARSTNTGFEVYASVGKKRWSIHIPLTGKKTFKKWLWKKRLYVEVSVEKMDTENTSFCVYLKYKTKKRIWGKYREYKFEKCFNLKLK